MSTKNAKFFSRFARDPLNSDVININLNYTSSVDYIIDVPILFAEVKAQGEIVCDTAVIEVKATGTITCATAVVGNVVDFNGLDYTAVAGAKADDTEFSIDTSNDATATDLADSIDDDVRVGIVANASATATTNVVTIVSTATGVTGNTVGLASSDGTTLAVSAAALTGGVDVSTVTVNGLLYTAVAGAKANDTEFSIDTSNDATATDLADSIDDDTRGTVTDVSATATTDTVTIVSTFTGVLGNAVTMVSANDTLAPDSATLTGGQDEVKAGSLDINRLIIYVEDAGTANTIKYGAETAWTNGTSLIYERDGVEIDLLDGQTIKTNANLGQYNFDVVLNAWGGGNINVISRWSFDRGFPDGIVLRGSDRVIVRTNIEDMQGVITNTFLFQGHVNED